MRLTINPERIEELKEFDQEGAEELLEKLVHLYLTGVQKKIDDLRELEDGSPAIIPLGHAIKSMSLNLGCELMADLGLKIEKSPKTKSSDLLLCEKELIKIKHEFEIGYSVKIT